MREKSRIVILHIKYNDEYRLTNEQFMNTITEITNHVNFTSLVDNYSKIVSIDSEVVMSLETDKNHKHFQKLFKDIGDIEIFDDMGGE